MKKQGKFHYLVKKLSHKKNTCTAKLIDTQNFFQQAKGTTTIDLILEETISYETKSEYCCGHYKILLLHKK